MDSYSLFQHFTRCYSKHYLNFQGRARRREYWGFTLYQTLLSVALLALLVATSVYALYTNSFAWLVTALAVWVIYQVFNAASILPSVAVAVRRLHDTGRSAWWLLVAYVPLGIFLVLVLWAQYTLSPAVLMTAPPRLLVYGALISAIAMLLASILLLVFFCQKSTPGENAYGLSPLEEEDAIA